MTSSKPKSPYYEDEFCKIDEKGIEIKNYYFPIFVSILITWDAIENVQTTETLDFNRFQVKEWGMGVSSVWWALGFKYKSQLTGIVPDHNIVIKCKKDIIRKGFSVEGSAARIVQIIKQHMV